MKALSVLLLLALGLGAAWWRITYPAGTLDDARREASALAERARETALGARDDAVIAFARFLPENGTGGGAAPAEPDAADVDVAALEESADDGVADEGTTADPAALDIDPAIDPLAAVTAPAPGAAPDTERLLTRIAALESRLASTPTVSTTNVVKGRLTDAERRLDATAVRESATLERLETIDARLGRIAERLEASAIESTRRHDETESRFERLDETLAALVARDATLADRLDTLGASRLDAAGEPGDPARALPTADAATAGPASDGEPSDTDGDAVADAGGEGAADGESTNGDGADDDATGDEPAGTADADGDAASGEPVDPDDADTDADGGTNADRTTSSSADAAIAARLETLAAGLDRRLAAMETRLSSSGSADSRLDALAERVEALAAARRAEPPAGEGPAAPDSAAALPADGDPAGGPATGGAPVDVAQEKIRTELTAIGEQVGEETTSDAAPALGQALESTRERLGALEARVQALPAASNAADEAKATQDALEAQVRALETRLESLPKGTDPEIVSSITAVREQVDALASRGFVTQEELRETQEGRTVEYKIYFDRASTEIGDDAARVLDSFIAQEQNRTTGVSIFGFTDRQGSASYNQRLALERATNVRSYLIQNGLPYTKIRALNGLGEDAAAAILPDEAADAQQRVVVLYAEQP